MDPNLLWKQYIMIPINQIIARNSTSFYSLNVQGNTATEFNLDQSLQGYEDRSALCSSRKFILGSHENRIYHFDGTSEVLPAHSAGGTASFSAISNDETLLAIVFGSNVAIYDTSTLLIVNEVSLPASYMGVMFSEDNLYLWAYKYVSAPNGLAKIRISDDTQMTIGYDGYCARMAIVPGTDDIIISTNSSTGFGIIDTTAATPWTPTPFTGENGYANTTQDPFPIDVTPNGKYAFGVNGVASDDTYLLNILTMESVQLTHVDNRKNNIIQYYNGYIYAYNYGNTFIDYATFDQDTGVMGPWKSFPLRGIKQVYIPSSTALYHVTGTITDTAEETQFVVTVLNTDRVPVGVVELPDGVVDFDIPTPSSDAVHIVITGVPREMHEEDHEYYEDDIIFTNDSDRSYVCTTGGITDVTKPAYPTSGTVTDGTAVFTVRGKLAKPVTNFPVYPTLV